MLDEKQKNLHLNFGRDHYLSSQAHVEKIIEWITFYRKNLNRFAQHYLGLDLFLYQHIILYLMNLVPTTCLLASRAAGKSFILAIYACCRAILYPGSKIVIASATKGQAKVIVSEKIKIELISASPVLEAEISNIIDNGNDTVVQFENGSTITVVVANQNARGHRSNLFIYEEARLIDKNIIDTVLSPFQVVRTPKYMFDPFYSDLEQEIPISVYITSAWYRSHWLWPLICKWDKMFLEGGPALFLAMDYSIALKHKIKDKQTLLAEKRKIDPIAWRMEYCADMVAEGTAAFFTYDMFAANQNLKRPFYPSSTIDANTKTKNPYVPLKKEGEIRVLVCDMAFVTRKGNDNSIFELLRLLPESKSIQTNEGSREYKRGYRKQIPYLESVQGGDTIKQAVRIKQLFYDFDCDYIVLDTRNAGIAVYDLLAKSCLYDEERGVEYGAWKCMNDENVANRIQVVGALECIFAINASQKLNSDIANVTRTAIMDKTIDLLVSYAEATDELLPNIPEYINAIDANTLIFYERPWIETQALINECIELTYEKLPQTGLIKLSEQGNATKDRYTAFSYGIYFASLLEQDLLSDNSSYEPCVFVN